MCLNINCKSGVKKSGKSQRRHTSIQSIRECMLVFLSLIRIAIKERRNMDNSCYDEEQNPPALTAPTEVECFFCCWTDSLKNKNQTHEHTVHTDKCKRFLFFVSFWQTKSRNTPSLISHTSKDLRNFHKYFLCCHTAHLIFHEALKYCLRWSTKDGM